jgi:UDP-N-acetylglucosamine diphosphorylase/glucosamine-1-phosphate N-acetyltransferase
MNIQLFDDAHSEHLLPLTFTRPSASIRNGILTNQERWEILLPGNYGHLPFRSYLSELFSTVNQPQIWINGRWLPSNNSVNQILNLQSNQFLVAVDGTILASPLNPFEHHESVQKILINDAKLLCHSWDLFVDAATWIDFDFQRLTHGRLSQPISKTNTIIGDENLIFIEEGAVIEASVLNTKGGPIYIGVDAEVMEGSLLRGPISLGEHAQVKMAAKIYGPSIFGPHCRVGGEVNNSVMLGYSNKGHDGFLGNSVLGEWCNLGADTNNSNLKNNYAPVKLWSYAKKKFEPTGLQFCGLIMGDHSKSGINSMFNTGTVVGVGCNLFGDGFPRNFVPGFSWGGASGFITHQFNKFVETAEIVYSRRGLVFDEATKAVFYHIFQEETQSS